MEGKFSLGNVVMTVGVSNILTKTEIHKLIERHISGDWGDLSDEDRYNDEALISKEDRILSSYITDKGKIWVITEYDYLVTTILLPEEY